MHLSRDWTMVVPKFVTQALGLRVVTMVVPSGLGEACRAAYARHASSHVHANRLLRLAALWDRPCGSGLLCAHQASSPRVNLQRPSNENTPTGNMH